MRTDRVYKQAIKRVFAEKFHDNRMAVYWGRDDDTINVIASQRHYVCRIANVNEDTLEFMSSVGDRVTVAWTDEERRQLERRDNAGTMRKCHRAVTLKTRMAISVWQARCRSRTARINRVRGNARTREI
jgi:hypothetical protein